MNFERLINKYLDGTISSKELQQLEHLLQAPENMTALRHTLEIRSHIHDDLLQLVPPSPLSERTRAAAAAQFASLQRPQPIPPIIHTEPKRRKGILPFRVAAGALVAVWLTTMLALTPTMLRDNQGDRTAANQTVQTAPPSTPLANAGRTARGSFRTAKRKSATANQQLAAAVIVPQSVPSTPIVTAPAATDSSTLQAAEQAPPPLVEMPPSLVSSLGVIPPQALHSNGRDQDQGNGQIIPPNGIDAPPVAPQHPTPGNRLFAVGVAIGSGNVNKLPAANVLMQNTYYFAFSLTKETRVGVEMGASTFYQKPTVGQGGDGFAKGMVGDPGMGAKGPTGPGIAPPPIPGGTSTTEQEPERSVTYGAIFYDRRLSVARSLDLCGRVTVGAADNALLGNLRAYLAYSPSNNVTLTAGIGGAGLYNITNARGENSVNYGVYYGIETGF